MIRPIKEQELKELEKKENSKIDVVDDKPKKSK
jgi:hypothetical protein